MSQGSGISTVQKKPIKAIAAPTVAIGISFILIVISFILIPSFMVLHLVGPGSSRIYDEMRDLHPFNCLTICIPT